MRLVIIPLFAAAAAGFCDSAHACQPVREPEPQYTQFAQPPPPRAPDCCEPPVPVINISMPPDREPEPVRVCGLSAAPAPVRVSVGATMSRLSRSDVAAEGIGGLLRFHRGDAVQIEVSLGRDRYENGREELRVGSALIAGLSTGGRLSPYLLIGLGAARIEDLEPRYAGFLEAGAGLSLRITDSFALAADVRWIERRLFEQGDEGDPLAEARLAPDLDEASGKEARLSAILSF
jgi:hypothetical protein